MFIIWWLIVGLIAGWITGKIMSGGGYGVIMDMVVGLIGALVGGFIMRSLGYAGSGGLIYTILVAVAGAVILTFTILLSNTRRINGNHWLKVVSYYAIRVSNQNIARFVSYSCINLNYTFILFKNFIVQSVQKWNLFAYSDSFPTGLNWVKILMFEKFHLYRINRF